MPRSDTTRPLMLYILQIIFDEFFNWICKILLLQNQLIRFIYIFKKCYFYLSKLHIDCLKQVHSISQMRL